MIQRGRPLLVEFWDFCRPNSMRTLPYLKAWHERYAADGLRARRGAQPRLRASREEQAVREAVARLGIDYPVLIDSEFAAVAGVRERGLARALPVRRARSPVRLPLRRGRIRGNRARDPGAAGGAARAACAAAPRGRAGGAAGTADGRAAGRLQRALRGGRRVGGARRQRHASRCATAPYGLRAEVRVEHRARIPLFEHERHSAGVLELEVGAGVRCDAVCFTPGVR